MYKECLYKECHSTTRPQRAVNIVSWTRFVLKPLLIWNSNNALYQNKTSAKSYMRKKNGNENGKKNEKWVLDAFLLIPFGKKISFYRIYFLIRVSFLIYFTGTVSLQNKGKLRPFLNHRLHNSDTRSLMFSPVPLGFPLARSLEWWIALISFDYFTLGLRTPLFRKDLVSWAGLPLHRSQWIVLRSRNQFWL